LRSIWKGTINFAVVAIPAKLYTATDDKRVSFHQIHGPCGSRLQMPKWCPKCERKAEQNEIKKGYELSEENHVILEDSDFQQLPLKTLKTIEVIEFVDLATIDPRCFEDSYFLSCEKTGAKAFALFLKAMEKHNVVAVAKLCYRDRENLAVVQPYDNIMLLQRLHYADELRPYEELKPQAVGISDKELEMAVALVKAMITGFDLNKYRDEYREALEAMIQAKIAGTPITASQPVAAPVTDVADALIKSLEMMGAK